MKQYFVYVRKSTDEADKQVLSIDAQLSIIRDFVRRHGLKIKETFREARSAMKPGRPVFNDMIKRLEKGKAHGVIAHKTDRLSRNDTDSARIFDLMSKGYEIIFVDTPVLNNAVGRATLGMQLVWAKFYSENLSEEAKKGMKEKVRQGGWPNLAPIGYLNVSGEIVPDPQRAPFIKKAFEWRASEDISVRELSRRLYEEGFRNRNGGRFARSAFHKLLRNPFYYGEMTWDGGTYRGKHQPLITKQLWNKVQDALRKKTRPRWKRHDFPFRGFLTCGECSCSITAQYAKRKYIYYRCSKAKHSKCRQPYIREEELVKQLEQVIKCISIDEATLRIIKKELLIARSSIDAYRNNVLGSLRQRRSKLENAKKNLWDLRIESCIPKEIFDQKLEAITKEQEEIREKLAKHNDANDRWYEDCSRFLETATKVHELFKVGTLSSKRAIIGAVCSNLVLKDRKIVKITWKKPFDILARKERKGKCSRWYPTVDDVRTFNLVGDLKLSAITRRLAIFFMTDVPEIDYMAIGTERQWSAQDYNMIHC